MCYFLYLEIARRTCRIRENVHDVCIDKQNSGPRISLEFQLVCDWMAERSFRNAVSLVSSIFPSTKRSQLKKKRRAGGEGIVWWRKIERNWTIDGLKLQETRVVQADRFTVDLILTPCPKWSHRDRHVAIAPSDIGPHSKSRGFPAPSPGDKPLPFDKQTQIHRVNGCQVTDVNRESDFFEYLLREHRLFP